MLDWGPFDGLEALIFVEHLCDQRLAGSVLEAQALEVQSREQVRVVGIERARRPIGDQLVFRRPPTPSVAASHPVMDEGQGVQQHGALGGRDNRQFVGAPP